MERYRLERRLADGGRDVSGLRVPDFIVIGSARCGTTALWTYLAAHDEIEVPSKKELDYFARLEPSADNLQTYLANFDPIRSAPCIGEASPSYMTAPEAARRMAQVVPHARLVVTLRDPVDRAYSHYWFRRLWRAESRSFADVVSNELSGNGPEGTDFLHQGQYLHQLRRYEGYFDRSQLHVTTLDHLKSDPEGTFRAVCRHLGVTEKLPDVVGERVNAHHDVRSVALWRGMDRWRGKSGRRYMVTRALDRVNAKRFTPPPMPTWLRAELEAWYETDDRELAEWLGWPLPWRQTD